MSSSGNKRNQPQSVHWVFTLNNPSDNGIPKLWKDVKYAIWQREMGENGTPHLQGYVVFNKRVRLSALSKMCYGKAHWEIRRGTHSEAKAYCSKLDSHLEGPWTIGDETGIPEGAGARTDLDLVKADLDAGKTESFIMDTHFTACCKYMRFFKEYKRMKTPQRTWKTEVEVLWGPTGCSKSFTAMTNYPDAYWKPKSDWWDGYDLHDVVIIDEFYGWLAYDFMLRLLDKYPLIVNTKFGHASFVAKKIIITSNQHPKDWYTHPKAVWAPLERRITSIKFMDKFYIEPPVVTDITDAASDPSTSAPMQVSSPPPEPYTSDGEGTVH